MFGILRKYWLFWPGTVRKVYLFLFFLGFFYLLLPYSSPSFCVGESYPLPSGYESRLAGLPCAYCFTNKTLGEVKGFYQEKFSYSSFLNLPLPTTTISFDTQYVYTFINDMHNYKNKSFLIGFFHPLRESLVITGRGETNFNEALKKGKKKIITFKPEKGKEFHLQVVVYYIEAPLWARLLAWTMIFIFIPVFAFYFIKELKNAWKIINQIRNA